MFDASWAELLFIALLALILLGPKELPVVLRTVGRWLGKAQAIAQSLRQQVDILSQDPPVFDKKNPPKDPVSVPPSVEEKADQKGPPHDQ